MAISSSTRSLFFGRSLYWRIVLGFGACIACVLAIQVAALALWLRSVPDDQRLQEYTREVADDLSAALTQNPDLDVQHYMDARYGRPLVSLVVNVARGNREAFSGPNRPPQNDAEAFREWWSRP